MEVFEHSYAPCRLLVVVCSSYTWRKGFNVFDSGVNDCGRGISLWCVKSDEHLRQFPVGVWFVIVLCVDVFL